MRAPEQAAHVDTAGSEAGEHAADFGARAVEKLVGVSFPVGEPDTAARGQPVERPMQTPVVLGAVDEDFDMVARGPRGAVAVQSIDRSVRVPSFNGGEEPVREGRHQRPS
jgi:hypothetical protein